MIHRVPSRIRPRRHNPRPARRRSQHARGQARAHWSGRSRWPARLRRPPARRWDPPCTAIPREDGGCALFQLRRFAVLVSGCAAKREAWLHSPGDDRSAKMGVLELGAKTLQPSSPLNPMDVYLVGFHPIKHDPHRQMDAPSGQRELRAVRTSDVLGARCPREGGCRVRASSITEHRIFTRRALGWRDRGPAFDQGEGPACDDNRHDCRGPMERGDKTGIGSAQERLVVSRGIRNLEGRIIEAGDFHLEGRQVRLSLRPDGDGSLFGTAETFVARTLGPAHVVLRPAD